MEMEIDGDGDGDEKSIHTHSPAESLVKLIPAFDCTKQMQRRGKGTMFIVCLLLIICLTINAHSINHLIIQFINNKNKRCCALYLFTSFLFSTCPHSITYLTKNHWIWPIKIPKLTKILNRLFKIK
jgi:hypothetical protein